MSMRVLRPDGVKSVTGLLFAFCARMFWIKLKEEVSCRSALSFHSGVTNIQVSLICQGQGYILTSLQLFLNTFEDLFFPCKFQNATWKLNSSCLNRMLSNFQLFIQRDSLLMFVSACNQTCKLLTGTGFAQF